MGEDRDDLMNGAPRSDASTVSRLRPRLPGCPYRLAAYICLWYTVSVGLTLYNKWLFYHHGFSFPLTATAFHFAIKVPLAWIVLRLRNLRWRVDSRTLWRYVAPVGLATAADIACSNTAFLYITVTYYTVAKSSVPLWILLFSVCLRLRRMRRELALVLVLIAAGICLASFDLEEDVEPVLAEAVEDAWLDGQLQVRDYARSRYFVVISASFTYDGGHFSAARSAARRLSARRGRRRAAPRAQPTSERSGGLTGRRGR
jgi:hypothetical protein